MILFKIQYNTNGSWKTYTSDDGNDIQFLTLDAAQSVAKDMSSCDNYPSESKNWKIKDSVGNEFSLTSKLPVYNEIV